MNPLLRHHRTAVTGLLVVVALYALAAGLRDLAFLQRQFTARAGEQRALERIAQEAAEARAPFDWMTRHARAEDRLAAIIARELGGVAHDLALRERKNEQDGWQFQRYDLRIDRIDAAAAARFLAACENARPPVRLVDIQVSATPEDARRYTLQLALAEAVPPAAGSSP